MIFAGQAPPFTVANLKTAVQKFVDTSELSPESIANAIRNISPFVVFSQKRGLLCGEQRRKPCRCPSVTLIEFKPRVPKKDVVPFEPDEITQLVKYWEIRDAEFSRLLRFLYATGFRINEALTLEWEQIGETVIRLRNKTTDDTEYFPVTDEVRQILSEQDRSRARVLRWPPSRTTTNWSHLYRRLKESLEELNLRRIQHSHLHLWNATPLSRK